MQIIWTYGAINQDAQQNGLFAWNWSATEGAAAVQPQTSRRFYRPQDLETAETQLGSAETAGRQFHSADEQVQE